MGDPASRAADHDVRGNMEPDQVTATRWYLRHRNGAIYLTVERVDDLRGYTMAWSDAVGGRLLARRAFRCGLHLLRQRVDLIGRPVEHRTFDPVEVVDAKLPDTPA